MSNFVENSVSKEAKPLPNEESSISTEVTRKDEAQETPIDSSTPTTPIDNNVVREAVQAEDSVSGKQYEESKSEVYICIYLCKHI
jgi:hypothetical protein